MSPNVTNGCNDKEMKIIPDADGENFTLRFFEGDDILVDLVLKEDLRDGEKFGYLRSINKWCKDQFIKTNRNTGIFEGFLDLSLFDSEGSHILTFEFSHGSMGRIDIFKDITNEEQGDIVNEWFIAKMDRHREAIKGWRYC